MKTKSGRTLPPIAKRKLGWFTRFVGWFLPRNFHGLHLLRLTDLEKLNGVPLLVCLNHPSWWDPLIALYLSQRFFPDRHHVAPLRRRASPNTSSSSASAFLASNPTPFGAPRDFSKSVAPC